jgi:MFS family permease
LLQPGTEMSRTDTERGQSALKSWYVVGVLSLLYAFSIVDRLIMPVSIQQIRRSLGISDFQISLMMGLAFAIFYSLCALPLGALIDRYSRRWVIFSGILVWSLAASACGLATTPAQLFGARMAVGAGEAALSPAAYSILSDLFPRDRLAAPISIYTIGGVLGSASALAGGGHLLQYFSARGGLTLPMVGTLQRWQSVFICTGAPGLVVASLIFTFAEPARRSNRPLSVPVDDSFGRFLKAVCGLTAHALNGFAVDRLFRRHHRDAHLKFFIYSAVIAAPLVVLGLISGRWLWVIAAIILSHLMLTPFVGYAAAGLLACARRPFRLAVEAAGGVGG